MSVLWEDVCGSIERGSQTGDTALARLWFFQLILVHVCVCTHVCACASVSLCVVFHWPIFGYSGLHAWPWEQDWVSVMLISPSSSPTNPPSIQHGHSYIHTDSDTHYTHSTHLLLIITHISALSFCHEWVKSYVFMLTPDTIRQNTTGVADNGRGEIVSMNPFISFPSVPKLQIHISKYRKTLCLLYKKAIIISLNQQL